MKYALGSLILAGGLALSIGSAKADQLTLTSPRIQDNGTLAVKNACGDKQRSPNCVGENVSPPLAWGRSVPGGALKLTRFGGAPHTFAGGLPHGQNPSALLA